MYFISEESYKLVSKFANDTELNLKVDLLGNLYFEVNQFKINNINFIFGKQSLPFLMGTMFGYLYQLELSDISDIDINENEINEFKLRNICLNSPVEAISDTLGKTYINLLKSFEKVKYLSLDEIFDIGYDYEFLNLLSYFLIFCSYWAFEKGKLEAFEEVQDLNYVYLNQHNLKCAFKHGSKAVSIIRGEK